MSDENANNDLYEDLADTKVASKVGGPARASASTTILAAARPPSFSEQLDNLQRRVDELERENQRKSSATWVRYLERPKRRSNKRTIKLLVS
jgi:hypothetical protein